MTGFASALPTLVLAIDATNFIYTYVKQDDCPDIQAYYEYFENETLRMRSEIYRKRRFE
jgi:hypothetical protein